MKTIRVIAYPKNISDVDLSIYSPTIVTGLTGNPSFISTNPAIAVLGTANAVLISAISAQTAGNKSSTSAVHQAAAEVKRILRAIASSVEYTGNNNETTILSSGFNIKKPAVFEGKTFKAKQGVLSGTVDLEVNSYGIAAYLWEMSTDPIGNWQQVEATTISKTTIMGLTPGTKYWFRVRAI